jgi:uncharacterized membrane protein YhdT
MKLVRGANMSKSKAKRASGQLGCGFILFSGIILITLLVVNAFFVRTFFKSNLSGIDDRVFQAAQFILPIILVFIEFWIYDQIFNRGKLPRDKGE